MIFFQKKHQDPWGKTRSHAPEDFWASYSDLMAALLMVFSLVTVITLLNIREMFTKPTEQVEQWRRVVSDLYNDQELKAIENVKINPETGALVISDENLRFGFNEIALSEKARATLHEAVPKYFKIIFQKPELLQRVEVIEISGHTDRVDVNQVNPLKSRQRAGQVLDFLLSDLSMTPYVNFLRKKAITAGYSDIDYPPDCKEDLCAKARRVEITIRLNDSDVLREFINIYKQIYKKT